MEKSLKEQNQPRLTTVLAANLLLYLVIMNGTSVIDGWSWEQLPTSAIKSTVVIALSVITGVLSNQFNHHVKAAIVFLNFQSPLPGCRAFSIYIFMDPRIDKDRLKEVFGPFPEDPDKQNALWFKWYSELQEQVGIKQAHREYLFTRDCACIALILTFILGLISIFQIEDGTIVVSYIVALICQYLLFRTAAKNHGIRFVTSVLAHKATTI